MNNELIIGIHSYYSEASNSSNDNIVSGLYLNSIFDFNGSCIRDVVTLLVKEFFQEELMAPRLKEYDNDPLLFSTMEELSQFASYLCKKKNCPKMILLSTREFNLVIEQISSGDLVLEGMMEYGTIIENTAFNKKSGIIGKIFYK